MTQHNARSAALALVLAAGVFGGPRNAHAHCCDDLWASSYNIVVRPTQDRYVAVQGTAPSDGCLLRWEEDALRIVSPCSHVVYDLEGRPVTGLSTRPLQGFPVFLRDAVVYVGRA